MKDSHLMEEIFEVLRDEGPHLIVLDENQKAHVVNGIEIRVKLNDSCPVRIPDGNYFLIFKTLVTGSESLYESELYFSPTEDLLRKILKGISYCREHGLKIIVLVHEIALMELALEGIIPIDMSQLQTLLRIQKPQWGVFYGRTIDEMFKLKVYFARNRVLK